MNNKTLREMRTKENQRAHTSITNKRKRAAGAPGVEENCCGKGIKREVSQTDNDIHRASSFP